MPSGIYNHKPLSEEHKKKISEAMSDEKHHQWKGNKVGYNSLHNWITKKLGRPKHCAYCRKTNLKHRQYNWANISHSYKRELSDWIRLCGSCHSRFDRGKIIIKD